MCLVSISIVTAAFIDILYFTQMVWRIDIEAHRRSDFRFAGRTCLISDDVCIDLVLAELFWCLVCLLGRYIDRVGIIHRDVVRVYDLGVLGTMVLHFVLDARWGIKSSLFSAEDLERHSVSCWSLSTPIIINDVGVSFSEGHRRVSSIWESKLKSLINTLCRVTHVLCAHGELERQTRVVHCSWLNRLQQVKMVLVRVELDPWRSACTSDWL